MPMPYYVSPEQMMQDKAEYAKKGIAKGRSIIAMEYAEGILLTADNPSASLHKVSEIYDCIAFAGAGKYSEFENLRKAGIRHADLTSDNILMDSSDRLYLVDFDKASIMSGLDDWQWQPLYRFQRSIEKRHKNQHLHYDADDWQVLMDAYQS